MIREYVVKVTGGEVGMTIERMIELLEIEHECMLRGAHDDCDRKCADCELVQEDDELHEMYTNVVQLLKEHEDLETELTNAMELIHKKNERIKKLLREQNNCENCAIAIEDRQPVVRCKDCRYLSSPTNGVPFCKHIKKFVDADWFCADGESRESGNE